MTHFLEDNGKFPLLAKEGDRGRSRTIPKLCGADVEFGNFFIGRDDGSYGTAAEAATALLAEIDGVPHLRGSGSWGHAEYGSGNWGYSGSGSRGYAGYGYDQRQWSGRSGSQYDSQDWGRKFLRNGQCWYIDLSHLEGCIPEVLSAEDWVAAWHALLRFGRRAQEKANTGLPNGQRIEVLANNSDGRSNSYGSHLNFLITRDEFDNIFERKAHHLLYLAAYQVSSIVFAGQGKVGAENDAPAAAYQLSQRADFFETLAGMQTTYRRPIVNSRDEPLCGDARSAGRAESTSDLARVHVIFYDSTLCHVSSYLKVGGMQIILAMLESGQLNPNLLLDDPLQAVQRWSHDPTLQARADTVSGRSLTAVELQLLFCEEAQRFVVAGGCEGIVPHAHEITCLWEDTLVKLKARDLPALTGRLDWVLKLNILQRAFERRPALTWSSPEIKLLDHLYSSVAPNGLYWSYEESGVVERIANDERIEYFVHNPPADTRAWTRAMLLRLADRETIEAVDWDHVLFRSKQYGYQRSYRRVDLANPLSFTRSQTEQAFQQSQGLDELLDALGAPPPSGRDLAIRPSTYAVH